MWDLIVSVPDHCLSFYFNREYIFLEINMWIYTFELPVKVFR